MIEPRQLPTHLLSQGRFTFTLKEAQQLLDLDERSAISALSRLRAKKLLFSPARGLYVLISPEYQSWGVLPAEMFVDALMRHLGRPYYVGYLSAAAVHGASHHAPQVFQIVTPQQVKPRDIERVRLRFYRSTFFEAGERMSVTVPTGEMQISTKETTVVDLIATPRLGGGLDNVATIIAEIGALHGSSLARVAAPRGLAIVRRVGWAVEEFGQADDLEALRQAARLDQGEPSMLAPSRPRRGSVDKRWSLRLNATVEPDV